MFNCSNECHCVVLSFQANCVWLLSAIYWCQRWHNRVRRKDLQCVASIFWQRAMDGTSFLCFGHELHLFFFQFNFSKPSNVLGSSGGGIICRWHKHQTWWNILSFQASYVWLVFVVVSCQRWHNRVQRKDPQMHDIDILAACCGQHIISVPWSWRVSLQFNFSPPSKVLGSSGEVSL